MIINTPPDFFVKAVWTLSTILLLLVIYYLINIGNNFIPEKRKIKYSNRKIMPILGLLILIYIFYVIIKRYPLVGDTFYTIIFSIVLAYLIDPLVDYLESRGMKRILGVITIYFIVLGIIFVLAFLVVPRSGREIRRLLQNLPDYFSNISDLIDSIYVKYYSTLGDLPPLFQGVETIIIDNISKIENLIVDGLTGFVGGIINTFSKIISWILTPILTFYLLVDKQVFLKKIKDLIPIKHKTEVITLAKEIDHSVTQFIRGRLIMALYVGIATTITLLLMGIEFAIVIGFITGIADIIPYIGPFLGFIPAFIFAFISSPIKALWVSIFFVIIQWVENNILAPKIIGETTGMHPLTILISIIVGGAVFGVLGMILSVPFVAVVKIFYAFIVYKIKNPPQEEI